MKKVVQRLIFKILSLDNYLRVLQRSYFVLYKTGILRFSKNYSLHYFVKRFINKDDVIIDIGANLGYYSVLFANWVKDGGHVYAVEPIKIYNKIYKEMTDKCDNITLYPYALGMEEKEIEMVSPSKAGFLSTGLPHVYDEGRDGDIDDIEFRFKAEMKIPSKLFGGLDRINYIKCDVEGFEYIILSDMKEIIAQHRPKVQVEVWGDNRSKIMEMFHLLEYLPYFLSDGKLKFVSSDIEEVLGDYIFIHKDDKHAQS